MQNNLASPLNIRLACFMQLLALVIKSGYNLAILENQFRK